MIVHGARAVPRTVGAVSAKTGATMDVSQSTVRARKHSMKNTDMEASAVTNMENVRMEGAVHKMDIAARKKHGAARAVKRSMANVGSQRKPVVITLLMAVDIELSLY